MAPMLPDGRRLGAHLPLATGMVKAVERAHEIGATALQVFGDNPTAWRRRAEPPTELPAFRERLAALDIGPVAIHASYLINLAGPEPDFLERSVGLLTHELQAAPGFEARFVNVHIGSHRGAGRSRRARRASADAVARVLAEVDDTPEAARARARELGGRRLRPRDERRRARGHRRGDRRARRRRSGGSASASTPPTPGAPAIDLSDPGRRSTRFLAAFDARIGLDRLVMVHLNDSKSERGSRTRSPRAPRGRADRRGGAGARPHATPLSRATTYYLETPGHGRGLRRDQRGAGATTSAAGRPLPELPPEAMTMRGSRARTASGRANARPAAAA